ncbi:MAG: PAS domain S-box protein [Candidatus Marinimicrobia bacterium]|nr:PAS domain S-box protein [Candidatus Neomarinimicrobiota bacterium]
MLLASALNFPIHDFLIADDSDNYLDLLQAVVQRGMNRFISKSDLTETDQETEHKPYFDQEQSHTDFKQLYSLLRSLTDTVPDMIWAKDLENRYIFTNSATCKNLLNAVSTLEPLNKDVMYFVNRERAAHPEDPQWFTFGEKCPDSDRITIEEGKLCQFKEYGNVFGSNLVLDIYKAPIYDDKNQLIGTVGSARDITLLEETKERYLKLFEYSPDPVVVHIDGAIITANQAAAAFLGAENREDYYGANVFNFIHKDYRKQSIERLKDAANSERPNELIEEKYVTLDGSIRDVEAISVPITYGNKKAWMATFRDITERKKSETDLQRSLKEKNALLREIHHRTRNNMQVIIAIINLRSREISDPRSKVLFKEVSDRITAMSLVHDRLYESNDLSAIDFTAYLTHLSTYIKLNHTNVSERVSIEIGGDTAIVSIDQAVPLGLVINEILTNAYKYAFPDKQTGSINIVLTHEAKQGLRVSITDNGIGLPLDAFNDSLSTVILSTLVKDQLGGSLEYVNDGGTRFTIHIPDVEIKRRI